MRSETQQTSRRRRGGRRHRGPHGPQNASSTPAPAKAPAKLGFFQRILAFFKGKPQPPGRVYGRVLDHKTDAAPNTGSSVSSNGNGGRKHDSEAAPRPKPIRKPELVEVTSPKLYVGNLSFDATESDLFELFAGVGSVQNAEVVSHRETHKSKGFAFVTLSSVDEAKRAVTELHDKEFMGRRLVVSGAKTNDVR